MSTICYAGEFGFSLIISYGDLTRWGRDLIKVSTAMETFQAPQGQNYDIMPLRNFYGNLQRIFTPNAILGAMQLRGLPQ